MRQQEHFVSEADEFGHLPFLPVPNPYQKIEIIIMADDDEDIITSPLAPEEWGL